MSQLELIGRKTGPAYPSEPILREALIEGNYRRWLKRQWGSGSRAPDRPEMPRSHCVGWAMLNPSLASGERDDPTLKRIIGFSYRWGFSSLVVGNVYPFISPNTEALRTWRASFAGNYPDYSARDAWIRNAYDCATLFNDCQLVIAAWGNGADPDDLDVWLETVEEECSWPIDWHCIGTTAGGAPKHPLARGRHRVPDDMRPVIWRKAA